MNRLSVYPSIRLSVFVIALSSFATGATCEQSEKPPLPSPVVQPIDPDGLTTELGQVCISLRAAKCPEGEPLPRSPHSTCYEHLVRMSERVEIPTACLILARTQELVRGCGTPQTLRFRCDR